MSSPSKKKEMEFSAVITTSGGDHDQILLLLIQNPLYSSSSSLLNTLPLGDHSDNLDKVSNFSSLNPRKYRIVRIYHPAVPHVS